jgi:plastocyanin
MRLSAFAALALLVSAAVAAQPATIEVRMSNFKFEPRSIQLRAGQDYAVTLINESSGGHSFAARDFFAAASVNPADRALIREGTIEVPGHQRRTIRFRAAPAGTYKVKCTHTLHGTFGMKGEIVVR